MALVTICVTAIGTLIIERVARKLPEKFIRRSRKDTKPE